MTVQGQKPASPCPAPQSQGLRVAGTGLALTAAVFVTISLGVPLVPGRTAPLPGDSDCRPRYRFLDFSQEWASARNFFNGKPIYRNHNEAIYEYLGFRRDTSD